MEGTGQFTTFIQLVSLVSKPEKEEEEEKGLHDFSCLLMCLIVVEFHHLCILLPYAYDTNTDTRRYTVCRFIIAVYGMQRNSLDCAHPVADLKL